MLLWQIDLVHELSGSTVMLYQQSQISRDASSFWIIIDNTTKFSCLVTNVIFVYLFSESSWDIFLTYSNRAWLSESKVGSNCSPFPGSNWYSFDSQESKAFKAFLFD